MISLRKYIDRPYGVPQPVPSTPAPEPDTSPLTAYCSVLEAVGECSQKAIPALGQELSQRLAAIAAPLKDPATSAEFTDSSARVRGALTWWADRAARYHSDNEKELREIIGVVAGTAESISRRGENWGQEIGTLTGRLRTIADMKDLGIVRRSILESAPALRACVERLAEESQASARQLTEEVSAWRARLEESERAAALDPLTRLANRRAFEGRLESKMAAGVRFSLILIDLSDFKSVNDTHGHLIGDELLRQFAEELRGQFVAADTVARWGGDEFAVIVAGDLQEAESRAERVRRWVLGEYKIPHGDETLRIVVQASLGVAEWHGQEDIQQLVARADKRLYLCKEAEKMATRVTQRA